MLRLDLTLPSPAENLACDEALLDAAEAGETSEILRFFQSNQPFVVLGYANKFSTEVNTETCARTGTPILRRCSGGGTVVQGPGCLSYALVLRIHPDGLTRSINSANRHIMERNRAALELLLKRPVSVCGHTDLAIDGVKFSGNAQRRRRDYLLFHGTILLQFDLKLIEQLLPMPSLQPDYRLDRPHVDFVMNLGIPADNVKTALAKAWAADTLISHPPRDRIAALVRDRYSRSDWNQKF